MKALTVTVDHALELREIKIPRPGKFEALVKILGCGICSTTDTELINGTQPYHEHYPCVLGHESIGEVVEVGRMVKNFKLGDWVTRAAGIVPGSFSDGLSSAWGGFCEYGIVTDIAAMIGQGDKSMCNDYVALRQNVLRIGKKIGLKGSILSIALAETLDWSDKLDMKDKNVCINGTGIAGLSMAIWAKEAGAKKVIALGRRNERLQLAAELGADETFNLRDDNALQFVNDLTDGGADCFIEATGAPSQMQLALRAVRAGGILGIYGVAPHNAYEFDWSWLPADIRITRHEPQEQHSRDAVSNMIDAGRIPVEKLMTHHWEVENFTDAFEAVKTGDVVKGMLIFS